METHYAVLGVASGAGAAEIRRAFRLLALRHHPDRAGVESTELFQRIALAYEILSDPIARSAYDARLTLAAAKPAPAAPAARGPAGIDQLADLIPRLAGALDVLVARGAARRHPDGSLELLVTAAEAARGGTAAIGWPMRVPCPTCGGCAQAGSIWCARCEFAGTVPEEVTVCISIPPAVSDGASFTVHVDEIDDTPPLRLRVRRTAG